MEEKFTLTGEYIKLDQLLKAANCTQSGGEAKMCILSGEILVNGEIEERRGRKIRVGDKVSDTSGSFCILVV